VRSQSLFCKEENNTKDVNKMQIETYAPRLARLCLFFPFDLADFIFIFSVRSSFSRWESWLWWQFLLCFREKKKTNKYRISLLISFLSLLFWSNLLFSFCYYYYCDGFKNGNESNDNLNSTRRIFFFFFSTNITAPVASPAVCVTSWPTPGNLESLWRNHPTPMFIFRANDEKIE
jgi:hypothetical protein